DVILKVNRHIIVNLQDFYQSIENQSLVVLEIYRSGRLTYIQIQSANAIPPVATIAGTVADAPPILQNRVAIAANGNDLNAQLSPYFGSAPFFIIVDLSTKQYSAVPNNAATGTVPYGIAAVQLVTASGAKAVIAQNYGPVMYQALMAAQLTLFRANPGKVLDALAQYESYLLTQVDSPTVQGMTRNVVPSGGSPFTSDDTDDEEEEQSGYKGMPYTIPPQGKYDPDLDPANAAQTTAGTTQYRVAIASLGTSISAGVAPLFGTAPYFIIYDSTTNQYQYMKNPALTDTRSYGAIATQAIVSQNINAVIAGNFGSRAYTALLALNIKPYVFQGTISDAINAYRSGKLLPAVSTSLPGFTYTQNIVPTGGAPFATDDEDDEEEEQSGYKGVPYTIPPQGKYDPTLDPNNAATTDQSSNVPAINPSIPQRVAVAATGNTLNASMASVFRTAPFYL
ncbi:magnetosome protein MamT, greigite-specific, partial [Candidatus Magnetomorum sp. HK-1]